MNLFRDLKSTRAILTKGLLFLILGIIASAMLLYYAQSWPIAALLVITVWAYCRFYYFAFYVIEHYVDSEYRFDGLISFVKYLVTQQAKISHDKDREGGNAG